MPSQGVHEGSVCQPRAASDTHTTHESEVSPALGNECLDSFGIHLAIVHAGVPGTKGSAGWGTNDPHGLLLIDYVPSQLTIVSEIEVPGLTVRFQCSNVERIQTFDLQSS